jgi:hypothetical protein
MRSTSVQAKGYRHLVSAIEGATRLMVIYRESRATGGKGKR